MKKKLKRKETNISVTETRIYSHVSIQMFAIRFQPLFSFPFFYFIFLVIFSATKREQNVQITTQ